MWLLGSNLQSVISGIIINITGAACLLREYYICFWFFDVGMLGCHFGNWYWFFLGTHENSSVETEASFTPRQTAVLVGVVATEV